MKSEYQNIKKKKISDIKSQEDALQFYKKMAEAYLELRLMSRQNEIKSYSSQKKIIKKNIARMMTYLNKNVI